MGHSLRMVKNSNMHDLFFKNSPIIFLKPVKEFTFKI